MHLKKIKKSLETMAEGEPTAAVDEDADEDEPEPPRAKGAGAGSTMASVLAIEGDDDDDESDDDQEAATAELPVGSSSSTDEDETKLVRWLESLHISRGEATSYAASLRTAGIHLSAQSPIFSPSLPAARRLTVLPNVADGHGAAKHCFPQVWARWSWSEHRLHWISSAH